MDTSLKARVARDGVYTSTPSINCESLTEALADGRVPRGPMRPNVWVNARQRQAIRLRVFYYRGIDIALTTILTLSWLAYPHSLPALFNMRLGEFAPYFTGWVTALAFLAGSHLYSFGPSKRVWVHALTAVAIATLGLSAGLMVQLLIAPTLWFSYAQWSGLMAASIGCLHFLWATAIKRGRQSGALTPNVVFVGATEQARLLIEEALRRRDINIIGIFDDRRGRIPASVNGIPVLGKSTDLLDHRLTPYLDCIAITVTSEAGERVNQLARKLSVLPNRIAVLVQSSKPDRNEIASALNKLAHLPVYSLEPPVDDNRRAFYKRLQDLVLGTIALIGLSPLLLIIGVAIRLDSAGPALFRQRRHGFNHEEIIVWKFRTMYHNQADPSGQRQVTEGDPRVTRVGRFLRSTSLDELPQLINVLLGHMSLVGPRPHAIGMKTGNVIAAEIVDEYAHRHRIKPGMTGWAAINGSRGPLHEAADVRRRVQLDIDYIERQSFWFDIWIMARTVPVILGDKIATR